MTKALFSFTRRHAPTFVRFAVCGGFGAAIDFGTLQFLHEYAGWRVEFALLASTGLALCFVFLANRFFTFGVRGGGMSTQAAKFLMVYLIAATLNYFISLGLVYAGVHHLLAKAIAIGLIMFFNYFLLKGFVFKSQKIIPGEEVVAA